MRTVKDIFTDNEDLLQEPPIQQLVNEYEQVCDELIDHKQVSEFSKEKELKELTRQILNSIKIELQRDENAIRFQETDRVDFKTAVTNLKSYIHQYCKDYSIYL
ncbi:hypothetical protein [Nonlabens sp.]|uniref:hypothetical protein n=1 Tax=Nonlabens sp. TaxID=1888209 RepID=UPI003F69F13A